MFGLWALTRLWVAFHAQWADLREGLQLAPIPLTWCNDITQLPRAPLVVYGMSPLVCTLPLGLPERYTFAGILQRPLAPALFGQGQLAEPVATFVDRWRSADKRIVCVDMGAMWWYAVRADARSNIRAFLTMLQGALGSLDVAGIVLYHEHQQIAGAAPLDDDRLLCWPDAPHLTLFAKIHAVVHHGGAGTVHTALQLGLPQGGVYTVDLRHNFGVFDSRNAN